MSPTPLNALSPHPAERLGPLLSQSCTLRLLRPVCLLLCLIFLRQEFSFRFCLHLLGSRSELGKEPAGHQWAVSPKSFQEVLATKE